MADTMFQPKRQKYTREPGKTIDTENLAAARANRERLRKVELVPMPAQPMSSEDRALIDKHYRANFEELCKRISPAVSGLLNAEDVVQEAYTRACETIHGDVEDFQPWFNQILRASMKNFQREEIMRGATVSLEEVDDEGWLSEAFPAAQEQRYELRQIKQMVDCFKPASAGILRMALFGQMSYEDISRKTGASEDSVKSLVKRFRKQLASL